MVKTATSESGYTTTPFNDYIVKGETKNIQEVSPYTAGKNKYISKREVAVVEVPGTSTSGTAGWVYQNVVVIDDLEMIPVEGVMQVIPLKGTNEGETIANPKPFGDSETQVGSIVNLYGIDDDRPVKFITNKTENYGIWINGSVVLYNGYILALQLVNVGSLKIWRQVSKNW